MNQAALAEGTAMTSPDTKQLIEQCDRDAAADWLRVDFGPTSDLPDLCRNGEAYSSLAEAFARHRLSALQQPDERDEEIARRVVEAVIGSNADGCKSASAAYQKCCDAARTALGVDHG